MDFDLKELLKFAAIIFPVVEALGILTAWHAIAGVRSAQGSVAWAVSLVTFPWLALPLYWVFGRGKFKGYVEALRAGQEEHVKSIQPLAKRMLDEETVPEDTPGGPPRFYEKLARLPFTRGNNVELLIDGPSTFGTMFACIDQAREYILLQYYIVHDDELGRELKDRLIAKAKQGVRVYFQFDEIGCHKLSKEYIEELKHAGVEMSPFKTTKGRGNRFQLNFRNHRKITVIDGWTAFVGGHNVGDEYMGRDPRFGRWRDTHIKIQGPVIRQVQLSFVKDWYWATRRALQLSWDGHPGSENGAHMLALSTGPADELDTCSLMFVQAIHSAQSRFWLASPYFVPNEAVLEALQIAALRGVDVRIILPAKADHRTVYLAGLSYLPQLDIPGLHLYRYEAGFLHQKVMLVDDSLAAVGTANADNRSFRLNFEITMLAADKNFAAKIEAMFIEDFNNSRIVEAEEYHRLGTLTKLGVKIARLLSPLL